MALKEEQFCRQIQRVESQAKADARKMDEKNQSQQHSKKRDFTLKLDEIEDQLAMKSDEADAQKRQAEQLLRENTDLKRQVDSFLSKENKQSDQFESIIDKLKAEVLEKERQCHQIESRETSARQEIHSRFQDIQSRFEEASIKLAQREADSKAEREQAG